MVYQEHSPHPGLKDHIKCYWTLTLPECGLHGEDHFFLAEGLEFSFILAEPVELAADSRKPAIFSGDCICGPMTRPIRMRPKGRLELLGVCFRPGGAYPFFPYPAGELMNASVKLDDLWGATGRRFIDKVQSDCHTLKERTEALDQYLIRRLARKNRRCDPHIAATLAVMESHNGQVGIERLAELAGVSIRQLERRFKERVGMSPKELCRILRFKSVLKHSAQWPADSWASTALACGYYDQSHMIRDFKYYLGASPAAYLSSSEPGERLFIGKA